jgi:hypothetical protein
VADWHVRGWQSQLRETGGSVMIGGLTADKPALFRHDKVTGQYWEATR